MFPVLINCVLSVMFQTVVKDLCKELVQEVPKIPCTVTDIPVQSTTIWSVHSTHGVHCSDQRGQTHGFAEGYKDPPVPRRLAGPGQIPPKLFSSYTNISSSLSGSRFVL